MTQFLLLVALMLFPAVAPTNLATTPTDINISGVRRSLNGESTFVPSNLLFVPESSVAPALRSFTASSGGPAQRP